MLKEAFVEQALSHARTFEWFKCFSDGWESVEDCEHAWSYPRRHKTDRQSTMFVIMLDCHTGHVNAF